jgi:hypothetical protein
MLQEDCWQVEEILLVGVVWDISMLNKEVKRKEVSVEISFGDMAHGQRNFPERALDGISSRFIVYTYDFRNKSIIEQTPTL